MRIDFEDFELYSALEHRTVDELIKDYYTNNLSYYTQIGEEDDWFYKSSPYHLYDLLVSRNTGLYEIWYDYIKRRVDRKSTLFDYGAGVGTLEVLLLRRYPELITAVEFNLLCMDFIHWRLHKRNFGLSQQIKHYDYVVSLDTLQRLPEDDIQKTLDWLLSLGDRCFIYVNPDCRHPLYNKMPFNIESYLKDSTKEVHNFHGLLDVKV